MGGMVTRPELLVGNLRPLLVVAKPSDAVIIGESPSNEFATALAYFAPKNTRVGQGALGWGFLG